MIAAETRRIYAFFARDMQMAVSYPLDFAQRIVLVLFQIVLLYFFSLLIGTNPTLSRFGGYLPFAAIGMAILAYFQTGFTTFSQAIRREQTTGTLEAVLMTPTSIASFLLGSSIWSYAWSTLTAIIFLFGASWLYHIDIKGSYLLALALLILMTLFFASLGIVSAAFVLVFKRGDPLGFFVGTFSALLGGAFFPIGVFPEWLQKVSYLIPLRYGLDGLRAILLEGRTFAETWPEFAAVTVFDLVLVPASFYLFYRALRRAKREGTLLQY